LPTFGVLNSAFGDGAWNWIDAGWERSRLLAAQRQEAGGFAEIAYPKMLDDAEDATLSEGEFLKSHKKQTPNYRPEPAPWGVGRLDGDDIGAEMAELNPLFPDLDWKLCPRSCPRLSTREGSDVRSMSKLCRDSTLECGSGPSNTVG
jgi:hypothetical protein